MRTRLTIRDCTKTRETLYGYSAENLIRRMYGRGAEGIHPRIGERITIHHTSGRIVGSAIIHEA
jgi:hypothetical protein